MNNEKRENEEEKARNEVGFTFCVCVCIVTLPLTGRLRGASTYVPTVGRQVGNSVRVWEGTSTRCYFPLGNLGVGWMVIENGDLLAYSRAYVYSRLPSSPSATGLGKHH